MDKSDDESPSIYLLMLIVALVIGATILAWPTSGYLLIAAACYFWIRAQLGAQLEARRLGHPTSRVLTRVYRSLRTCVGCLLLGLSAVCSLQIGLQLFMSTRRPESILEAELWLARCLQQLGTYRLGSVQQLLIATIVLGSLVVLFPYLRVGHYFAMLRRVTGRVFLALYTVTSFSFFTVYSLEGIEAAWVAERRESVQQALHRADQENPQLVAATLLQQSLTRATPTKLEELRTYFQLARKHGVSDFAVKKLAQHFAAQLKVIPKDPSKPSDQKDRHKVSEKESRREAAQPAAVVFDSPSVLSDPRIRAWASGVADIKVRLHEAETFERAVVQRSTRVSELQQLAVHALSSLVGLESELARELLSLFIVEAAPKLSPEQLASSRDGQTLVILAPEQIAVAEVLTPKWEVIVGSPEPHEEGERLGQHLNELMRGEANRRREIQEQAQREYAAQLEIQRQQKAQQEKEREQEEKRELAKLSHGWRPPGFISEHRVHDPVLREYLERIQQRYGTGNTMGFPRNGWPVRDTGVINLRGSSSDPGYPVGRSYGSDHSMAIERATPRAGGYHFGGRR